MTTTSKRALDVQYEGSFFRLSFQTTSGVDAGGNSEHPSKLTISADQTVDVTVDEVDKGVTFEFVGQLEFDDFREAIRLLAKELDAVYGVPS